MRAAISFIALSLYCACFSYYIWLICHPTIFGVAYPKTLYNFSMFAIFVFYRWDCSNLTDRQMHTTANTMCFNSMAINFAILALYFGNIITDPKSLIYTFNGSVIASSLLVLKSGLQHGYFKTKYTNA